MKTIWAIDPELHGRRPDQKTLPEGGSGDLTVLVCCFELSHLRFENFAVRKGPALPGNRSADLAAPRPSVEVIICYGIRQGTDRTCDTNLSPKRLPVKAQSCVGIGFELATLLALSIGEEAETLLLNILDQHHTDAWDALRSGGGKCGGVGVVRFRTFSQVEPVTEEVDRIFSLQLGSYRHL